MITNSAGLSVGMPVFNGEDVIEHALASLSGQTAQNIEIVISDNASTDKTVKICERWVAKDPRIRLLRSPRNLGAVENFQKTLHEAQAELFMWAAADDTWHPEFAARCISSLQLHEDRMFAMSAFQCTSIRTNLLNRLPSDILKLIEIEHPAQRTLAYSRLPWNSHKDNMVYAVYRTKFLRKSMEILKSIRGFQSIVGGAANEYRLLHGRGVFIDEVLFFKRYFHVPPGHPLAIPIGAVARFAQFIQRKQSRTASNKYSDTDHARDLALMLAATKVDEALAKQLLDAYS